MASRGVRIRLDIEYDGTEYSGFQRQSNAPTIQGEIEKAIRLCISKSSKRAGIAPPFFPHVDGSGRTDAGVHAKNQVVSFDWPEELLDCINTEFELERLRRAIDGITPPAIAIKSIVRVESNFDPRRSVIRKQYSYRILNRQGDRGYTGIHAWHVRTPLDVSKMIAVSRCYLGTHDFHSFRAGDCSAKNPVRKILLSEFTRVSDDSYVYTVQSKGFLKQMVRILVGTMVEVGRGLRSVESIEAAFHARHRDATGRTAPPQGLSLDWVEYGNSLTSSRGVSDVDEEESYSEE